jgi:hypothetical protein
MEVFCRGDILYVHHFNSCVYLTHEVDGGLGLVEGSGGHVNVEHHLPLAGTHRLVEAKPNLTTTSQWVIVSLRATGEKNRDNISIIFHWLGSTDWCKLK